ncbi:MAG: DUF502 domain-containing protein [Bacteroidia bacterium]|jgi:uncharacterized membrane protein
MNNRPVKRLGMRIVKSFLNGLLLVAPIAATLYVVAFVFRTLDGWLDLGIPGLGLLATVAGITLIGFLGSNLLVGPLLDLIERILTRAPFIKLIYTSIRDLMEAFVGDKRKFNQPILVHFMDGTAKPGFLTQPDLALLGKPGMVAVYLPHSYNFSGNLFFVDANRVEKIDVDSTAYMKFIVSGGVTDLKEDA